MKTLKMVHIKRYLEKKGGGYCLELMENSLNM